MSDSYLWHVTLDTGHGRRSYRDEVDDGEVALCADQIAEALAGLKPEVRPGHLMSAATAGGALLATVESERFGPLATFAVALNSRQGASVWEMLRKPLPGCLPAVGDAPRAPWCAIRLYPGINGDMGVASWLGDFGRYIGWAWMERDA